MQRCCILLASKWKCNNSNIEAQCDITLEIILIFRSSNTNMLIKYNFIDLDLLATNLCHKKERVSQGKHINKILGTKNTTK